MSPQASAPSVESSDRPDSLGGVDAEEKAAPRPDSPGSASPETSSDVEKNAGSAGGPPNALGWDGPDDPDNPMNWPKTKRYMQIVVIAVYTLIVNLAATMFAPGAAQLAADFGITDTTVISMTVSIYVLGFAIGPMILAPLSELYGRLPVYIGSGIVYVAFLLGSAFSTDTAMFIVFRFFCGCAGAASMAISGGTLADVIAVEQRAKWMSLFVMGPMLGPVIGPIAGGFIAQTIGWRWDFRILLIVSGAVGVLAVVFLRETYAPVLLRRRAERRGQALEDPLALGAARGTTGLARLGHDITRPLRLLMFSPIVLFLSLYAAFAFGLLFLLFTTFSTVYMKQYGFTVGISGLSYLGMGIGVFIGLATQAAVGQKIIDARTAKLGRKVPENRLAIMAYMAPVLPVGLFWYGWSVERQTHWIVPILGTVFIGIGIVSIMMPQMIYLVEVYGAAAGASALAANTVLRSMAGAFIPLAGPAMYQRLGYGWGNSLLGFLAIAFIPIPWILFVFGEKIRLRGNFQI
ncbi:MFS general substrate transporter [Thozetella sp. PMI_491]|nr:MFS general substrate transporter [Thozetella sp. PMI_491]